VELVLCFSRTVNLEVVKWLHYISKLLNFGRIAACRSGHLEVVKWLHYNRSEGCTNNAMDGSFFKWSHLPKVVKNSFILIDLKGVYTFSNGSSC
jgi:hypothetical protein